MGKIPKSVEVCALFGLHHFSMKHQLSWRTLTNASRGKTLSISCQLVTRTFSKRKLKRKLVLWSHLREFISSIAEFLTWIILDVKWEKILGKKQHFSVHTQNFYPSVAWNFLYINGKKRLIVPKDYFNVLHTKSLTLES